MFEVSGKPQTFVRQSGWTRLGDLFDAVVEVNLRDRVFLNHAALRCLVANKS